MSDEALNPLGSGTLRASVRQQVFGVTTIFEPALARVSLAVVLVVAAFVHSLKALTQTLAGNTPLADLGLIPLLALVLCLALGRIPRSGELGTPDPQVDWIVGLPLIGSALFLGIVVAGRVSYPFWTNRLDLLGLPLFTAGLVSLLFGARVLSRVRWPLLLLLAAWPYPYAGPMSDYLTWTTHQTVAVLDALAGHLGHVQALPGNLYVIGLGAHAFTVNVAPECAGADSTVGFLVVGGGLLMLARGRLVSKLAWLAAGVGVCYVMNIARIVLVFWVGQQFGQRAALDWLHPVAGLVIFCGVVAGMVATLPRVGLQWVAGLPGGRQVGEGSQRGRKPIHRLARANLAVVALAAVLLGVSNEGLARYDPFAGLSQAGAVSALAPAVAQVPGWQGRTWDTITWARPYFGADSTWYRDVYLPRSDAGLPVYMDVITASSLDVFSQFGLEACYHFHGFPVIDSARVDIGTPAPAQRLAYYTPSTRAWWSVLSWVWPVRTAGGKRFERIVLFAGLNAGPPGQQTTSALKSADTTVESRLLGFARALLSPQTVGA